MNFKIDYYCISVFNYDDYINDKYCYHNYRARSFIDLLHKLLDIYKSKDLHLIGVVPFYKDKNLFDNI